MSEHLFRFLLSELKTVRIICKGKHKDNNADCEHIIEMPISRLGFIDKCPCCLTEYFDRNTHENRLSQLREALKNVSMLNASFDIEFTLPEK